MFVVMIESQTYSQPLTYCETRADAEWWCEHFHHEFVDENGFAWDMYIEERDAELH